MHFCETAEALRRAREEYRQACLRYEVSTWRMGALRRSERDAAYRRMRGLEKRLEDARHG